MQQLFFGIMISFLFIIFVSWHEISAILAESSFEIFNADSSPHGIPYSDWIGKWWIWWIGIPNDKHPVKDYSDPERCSIMQDGPVWFLPDVVPGKGKINYSCTVPIGKSILIPITTTLCERAEKGSCGSMLTDADLEKSADNILTPLKNMHVTVDGKRVDLKGPPVKSGFFNITLPDNPLDIWGKADPGTYRAIATGYFLFLNALSPGEHEIELKVVDLLKGNEGPPPVFDPMRSATFKILVQ